MASLLRLSLAARPSCRLGAVPAATLRKPAPAPWAALASAVRSQVTTTPTVPLQAAPAQSPSAAQGLARQDAEAQTRAFATVPGSGTGAPVAKPRTKKKATSLRDPERPKRPLAPFMRFLMDFRKKNPSTHGKEILRVAPAKWKAMTEADKAPFEKAYQAEKAVYDKSFKEYEESGKLAAWKRDPARPKRPLTPFLQFVSEVRDKNPTLKMTARVQLAGTEWKSLSADKKAPYEAKFSSEMQEYNKAMNEYASSGKLDAWRAKKGLDTAKSRAEAKEKLRLEKEALKAKKKAKMEKVKARLAKAKLAKKEKAAKLKARVEARKARAKAEGEKKRAQAAEKKEKLAEKKAAAKEAEKVKKAKEAEKQAKAEETAKAEALRQASDGPAARQQTA